MAVLEVVKAGHPILKEVAEPVEHVNKKNACFNRRYGRHNV